MIAKRLRLTIPAGVLWLVGAFLLQSAVDEHMNFSLAAVLAVLIGAAVLFVPVPTVIALSMGLSWLFAAAAVLLAVIEWDWQALAAAVAYAVAGVLSFAVFAYVDRHGATDATSLGEPTSGGDSGPRRLIPAFRRHRRPAADQDGEGG